MIIYAVTSPAGYMEYFDNILKAEEYWRSWELDDQELLTIEEIEVH